MAVIELDLDAPHGQPDLRPPAHRYRWAGLAVVAALLLALGGAAPAQSVLWRTLGAIELDGSDFWTLADGRVFTLHDGEASGWQVTPDSLSQRWTTSLPLAPATRDARVFIGGRLLVTGGALLAQTPDYAASVLDPATGRVHWRSPTPIEQAVDGVGLSRKTFFRTETEYNRATGDPGAIYVSDDGTPHTEPPVRTDLHGTDLITGRDLWTVEAAGSVFATEAAGAVLMIASDRVALIDPHTGAVRRERAAPGLTWGRLARGLVLLRQGDRLLSFDPGTLEPRWRVPAGLLGDDSAGTGYCEDLVCRPTPSGLEVLDERTGRVRWRVGPNSSLRSAGDVVLEVDSLTQSPARLLDAASGAVRAEVGDWQSVASGDDALVLSRWGRGSRSRDFAVVRDGVVSPLGRADPSAQECRVAGGIVACRTTAGLQIFAYR